MTDNPCYAEWRDTLNPDAPDRGRKTYCLRSAGHPGPHYNGAVGVTWGAPTDWFGDAA